MKRIISKILVLMLTVVIMIPTVQTKKAMAASGSVTISVSKTEVEKGGSFNVTVSVNADTPLDAFMVRLEYDSRVLNCSGYAGGIDIDFDANDVGSSTQSKTYTYTFTALEAANSSSINITRSEAVTVNLEEIQLNRTGSSVNVVDHIASGNANLTNIQLSTGYLWPEFSSGTTVYAVGLDNSITSLNISCPTEDAGAKVSFDSSLLKDLKVGQTDVTITVTAENGATKTYVLQVVRYAAEDATQAPTEVQTQNTEQTTREDNTLKVNMSGKEYTVLRDISSIKLPEGYELAVEKYNSSDIAVAKSNSTKLTLAYLFDNEANGDFYIYDKDKNTFEKYVTVQDDIKQYIILSPESALADTKSVKTDIGGVDVMTYVMNDVKDIYFFYGMNSKGEKGWYGYDAKEGTIQRMYTIKDGVEEITTKSDNTLEASLKAENARLLRENNSLKSSKKAGKYKIAAIIVSIISVILFAYAMYLLSKIKKQREENDNLSEETAAMKKQLDETMDLVAFTDEKFAKEREQEKVDLKKSQSVDSDFEEEKPNVDDDILKSEIDKALDKLAKLKIESDSDFKFDFTDDDKYGKM